MLVNPVRWVKDRMGHPLEAYLEIEVRDTNGKLLTFRKTKAKSLLAPFLGLVKGQLATSFGSTANAGNSTLLDISGATRTYPATVSNYSTYFLMTSNAGPGDSSYGLVVGSSDAPNAVNQYVMGAIIPNGTGANQLSYGTQTFENIQNPSGTNYWFFRIIRTFTNNSTSSITVKEIGLMVCAYDSGLAARYFLIARDVISPVTVPSGATLTVRYILKVTVS
jgi:hypothetical protein